MLRSYARLLVEYCLKVRTGNRILIRTSPEAVPLVDEIYCAVLGAGGIPEVSITTSEMERHLIGSGNETQMEMCGLLYQQAVDSFDGILTISAPDNTKALSGLDSGKRSLYLAVKAPLKQRFMQRSGAGDLRWTLCVYPTPALAQDAGMSNAEYEAFVYGACGLDLPDPLRYWQMISETQQCYVDRLNNASTIRYQSNGMDIQFSTKGRKWINSDGQRNMPSGEVFTSPVEDSVNGYVTFDFPIIYMSQEIEGARFDVENGEIKRWSATRGAEVLDQLMTVPGARRFGEAAIGTNYGIKRHTKNILFDEKIGGTIHMAIGASYPETGGKNESSVHLDFIADMRHGSLITADGEVIYRDGYFIE
ncbi:aminopeptidase [bacterium]|nr:aminopeptidase [bacterium]